MRELPKVGERIRVTRAHPQHASSVVIEGTVERLFRHETDRPWAGLPGDLCLLLADHDGWSVTVEVLEIPPSAACGVCGRQVELGANGWMHPFGAAHNIDGVEFGSPTWRALGEQP